MTTWSSRTSYQGKAVNQGTKALLAAANKMVRSKTFGAETSDMTMEQGGYNKGGVAASAGTHDGGGAFDLTPFNQKNRVKVLRILGCASWHRPRNWDNAGGSEHIHTEVCGDSTASLGAKAQVADYYHDLNGLANNAKDPDWRPKSLPILFHLPSATDLAVRYAKADGTPMYDQPSTKGTKRGVLAAGDKFTPVAMVKVGTVFWVINADGKCVQHLSMRKTKPSSQPAPQTASKPLRVGTLNFPDKTKITTATEAARIKRAVAQINAAGLDILAIQEGVGRISATTPSSLMAALLKALASDWTAIVPTLDLNENYILRRKGTTDYKQHADVVLRGTLAGKALPGRHLTSATFKTSIGSVTVGDTQLVNDNRPGAEVQAGLAADALANIGGKRILLGDLNTSGPLKELTSAGMQSARVAAKTSGTRDAVTYTNQDKTKPSTNPDWLIDHIYVAGGLTVNGYTVVLDLDSAGNFAKPRVSDHSLVIVSLS